MVHLRSPILVQVEILLLQMSLFVQMLDHLTYHLGQIPCQQVAYPSLELLLPIAF